MGNFEKQIPHYIELINKEIRDLKFEDEALVHECDCEFCDQVDEIPDEDYPRHEEIEKIIKAHKRTVASLTRHAKLHGIIIKDKVAA